MSAAAAEHVEVFEDDAQIVERVAVLEHERRDLAERVLLEEVGRGRQRLGVDDLDAVGKANDVGGDADLADERRSSGRAQDEHGFPLWRRSFVTPPALGINARFSRRRRLAAKAAVAAAGEPLGERRQDRLGLGGKPPGRVHDEEARSR